MEGTAARAMGAEDEDLSKGPAPLPLGREAILNISTEIRKEETGMSMCSHWMGCKCPKCPKDVTTEEKCTDVTVGAMVGPPGRVRLCGWQLDWLMDGEGTWDSLLGSVREDGAWDE